jgi:uncharacterized protein
MTGNDGLSLRLCVSLSVAARYAEATAAGDTEALRDLYEPDAVVWHNFDGRVRSKEHSLMVRRWMNDNLGDLGFEDVRHTATPTGFVTQQVVTATGAGGERARVASCLVVTLSPAYRIRRVDEYLDSAQLGPLAGG